MLISGNTIIGLGGVEGLLTINGDRIQISNNYITSNNEVVIWLGNNFSEITISNNTLKTTSATQAIIEFRAGGAVNTTGLYISGNTLFCNGQRGIWIKILGGNDIDNITITNNRIYNTVIGINFDVTGAEQVNNSLISGNYLYGDGTNVGIKLEGDTNYIRIEGNYINNFATGLSTTAGEVTNYTVENNTFRNCATSITDGANDSNSYIRRNVGFATVNSGSSSGTGAQQTIAHELGGNVTPVEADITITLLAISGTVPFASASPTNTNIYITAPNGIAYSWRVDTED